MTVLIAVFAVVAGFALLVGGGDLLVRGAARLAEKLMLSQVVIGLTVVAFGTSVPELVVSLIAAFAGNPNIAAGNVVGSNILNIAAVLACTAVVLPFAIPKETARIHLPFMFLLSFIFVVMIWNYQLERVEGVILFALLTAFTGWMIRHTRQNTSQNDAHDASNNSPDDERNADDGIRSLGLIVVGIGLLWAGGKTALWGAVELSQLWGLSERVIALTVVAFGTSLPELVASLMAVLRKQEGMAVGNVIGSNIYNIGCVLGLTAMIHPITVDARLVQFDALLMLGVASGILYLLFLGTYMVWLLQPGLFG